MISAFPGGNFLVYRQKEVEDCCFVLESVKQISLSLWMQFARPFPFFLSSFLTIISFLPAAVHQLLSRSWKQMEDGLASSVTTPFYLSAWFVFPVLCPTVHKKKNVVLPCLMTLTSQSWEPNHNPSSSNKAHGSSSTPPSLQSPGYRPTHAATHSFMHEQIQTVLG